MWRYHIECMFLLPQVLISIRVRLRLTCHSPRGGFRYKRSVKLPACKILSDIFDGSSFPLLKGCGNRTPQLLPSGDCEDRRGCGRRSARCRPKTSGWIDGTAARPVFVHVNLT